MTAPLDALVSVFDGVLKTAAVEQLPLAAMLARIQDGTYQAPIDALRVLRVQDAEAYRKQKTSLLAFTPGCALHTRARKVAWKEKLIAPTQIIYLDVDHVDAPALKALVLTDPSVVFAFISPSGEGLKLGIASEGIADTTTYSACWRATIGAWKERFPDAVFKEDEHVKFLHALCFVSHDPELYVNAGAVPFLPPPPSSSSAPPPSSSSLPEKEGRKEGRSPRGGGRREGAEEQARVEDALQVIPADDYDTWLRVGMALHASGEHWARAVWDTWSQRSDKYDTRAQDEKWASFTAEGGVSLATLFRLAMDYGYIPPRPVTRGQRQSGAPPAHADTPAAGAAIAGEAAHDQAASGPARDHDALPYSDYTNALAFVRDHGANLRYCFPWGKWLAWTGTHWQLDDTGRVMRWAKDTVKRLARHAEDLDDLSAIGTLLRHVKASLSTAKLKALVENAQSELPLPVLPEDLDVPKWLLNVRNGTLDLQTGTLQPHQQTDLLTKCLQVPYDTDALCPTWKIFLWRIMGGTDTAQDSEDDSALLLETRQAADERAHRLIAYLQRAIGYSLTGQTREQCLFLLHGDGSNGKSTFIELLQALLEDYAQSTPSASLLVKNRHDGIPNDIARLRGARLVSAVEIGEGRRLNEELVKRLTGQDTMTARFLFAEFFDFTPEFKLFIACNHLPHIEGIDHAIWRRIQRIPFTVTIPETEQDRDLPQKLKAELPGILAWAVRGCLAWVREGLAPPEEVIAATTEYRTSMDVIGRFIDECCLVGDSYRVKANDLYEAYKRWCEASGETSVTLSTFGSRLEDRGYRRHKIGKVWRLGIALDNNND